MKKLGALIVAAALMAGGFATKSEAQIHQGLQEVSFSGMYYHGLRDNDDSRHWNVRGEYGYFFTDQLQLVGAADVSGARGASTRGHLGGGVDWHFPLQGMQNFIPYVGGRYMFAVGSGDHPDALGVHAGVNQFITRNVAVKYQLGYELDPSETSDAAVRATVGLGFFF